MNQKQRDLNEKLGYRTKCNKWKELKISGDIKALVEITGRSQSIISRAVNKGSGSLTVLRAVSKYFKDREEMNPGKTQYFASGKKNQFI